MNLATMRTKFAQHTSDLASAVSDEEIDAYLNRAYRFVIPADIGGSFSEGIWTLLTDNALDGAAGRNTYPIPDYVIDPDGKGVFIDAYTDSGSNVQPYSVTFLDIETDYGTWVYADRDSVTQGTSVTRGVPESILFNGREVRFSPIPDRTYHVKIPCNMGPQVALGEVDDSGIGNDAHAMAVVTSAASEFLAEIGNGEEFSIQSSLYDGYRKILQIHAHSRRDSRDWNRSF